VPTGAVAGGRTQPETGQNRGGGSRATRGGRRAGAGELQAAPASPVICFGGDRKPVLAAGGGSERREKEKRSRRRGGHVGSGSRGGRGRKT